MKSYREVILSNGTDTELDAYTFTNMKVVDQMTYALAD